MNAIMQIHRIAVGGEDGKKEVDRGRHDASGNMTLHHTHRPVSFDNFVGQEPIKQKIQTAIAAAQKDDRSLGHMLFMGPSGYGKTTLAQLVSDAMQARCVILTAYALTKPADLLSLLPTLGSGDVLFIDEIHRIKPLMEEILYTAMEDRRIDMIMPDGSHVNIPLESFTLIGATTQSHKLSTPLKNRFVYHFHMEPYTVDEVEHMVCFHLDLLGVSYDDCVISEVARHTETVPRMIKNTAITIRDWMSAHDATTFGMGEWDVFVKWSSIKHHGLTSLHERYLDILKEQDGRPIGLQTIAMMLEIESSIIETDVEPLLIKQGLIQKTNRGRKLVAR